jgi:hypothetical protein
MEKIIINNEEWVRASYLKDNCNITAHQLKVWREHPKSKLDTIKLGGKLFLYKLKDVIFLKNNLRKYERKQL